MGCRTDRMVGRTGGRPVGGSRTIDALFVPLSVIQRPRVSTMFDVFGVTGRAVGAPSKDSMPPHQMFLLRSGAKEAFEHVVCAPSLSSVGSNLAHDSDVSQTWQTWSKPDMRVARRKGRFRQCVCRQSARFGPGCAKIGRCRPNLARIGPDVARGNSADRPICTHTWGRHWVSYFWCRELGGIGEPALGDDTVESRPTWAI